MGMNIVDKLPKLDFAGVPIGGAIKGHVGLAIGDTVGAVAIRYLPANISSQQYFPVALKLALAAMFAKVKPVRDFVGPNTAEIASLVLAVEAVGSIWNIRAKLDSMLSKFAGQALPATSTGTTAGGVNAGDAAGQPQDIVV